MDIKITPTVLENNFSKAEERIRRLKDISTWIQIDVIDGKFSQGKTFELELLTKLDMNSDAILWDIHLMVKEPEKWVNKCQFVGASRVIGQVEMMNNREDFVSKLKDLGMEAGLAFDIDTPVDGQIPNETDIVLLLGRKAGFGSYELDKRVLEKVKVLKKFQDDMLVAIDGGVDQDNIGKLMEAGVDVVYSGSNYFELIKNENE